MCPVNIRLLLLILFSSFAVSLSSQIWMDGNETPADNPNFNEIMAQFEAYWDGREIERGKGYKPVRRWEYQWSPRVNEDGSFPTAGRNISAFESYLKSYQPENRSVVTSWESMGPSSNTSGYAGTGRVASIGFHPTNLNIIYVGSAGGGLWKTTDGGTSWIPLTDLIGSIGVSAVIVDPSNPETIYIGTGDGDASDNYSIGVLKSLDGGITWNATGLNWSTNSAYLIRAMVIDPNDSNTLMVASNNGIYRTTNAGTSWVLEQSGTFYDIEVNPLASTNTFYACTKTQVFRSTNNGDTWTNKYTISGSNRLALATTAANSNYVYVLASDNSINNYSGFKGVYRSTDQANGFTLQSSSPNLLGWSSSGSDVEGQGWYDLVIAVDPDNANSVHVGGVNHWRSTNGGVNWSIKSTWNGSGGVPTVHADKHALEWQNNSTLWEGNDGGIYKTTNDGTTWTDKTSNLVISQMYKIGVSELDSKVIAGLQDNGTKLKNTSGSWTDEIGGDGMDCAINPLNASVMYGSIYYGIISRSTNSGSSWSNISNAIPTSDDGAWVTPYVLDPSSPSTIVVGYKDVYKSTNQGSSWTTIGSGLTSSNLLYADIAPSNGNYIYVGRNNQLWRTTNGGSSWTTLNGPGTNTAMIKVHSTNPDILYAVRQNYSSGNKVYKSTNGGSSWTNISGSLPNIPANCIAFHDDGNETIYVGMDVGVYYRNNTTTDWVLYNTSLPNVQVSEVEIKEETNEIYIATYGRGVWKNNTINGSSVCSYPLQVLVSDVEYTTATFSWTPPSPAPTDGYEWAVNTSTTIPVSTTETTSATVNITGLDSATPYYFFVRSKCSETSNSSWITVGPIATKNDCGDDLYDSGGYLSNYGDQEEITTVLCPSTADQAIELTFNSFDVEFNFDALYVYNGNSINSPQISSGAGATLAGFPAGGYYGIFNPGPFTSTDETGCLTLHFLSDNYVTGAGWDVDITCETLCSDQVYNTNDDGWGSIRRTVLCAEPGSSIIFSPSMLSQTFTSSIPILIDKATIFDLGIANDINLMAADDGPVFEINSSGSLDLNHLNLFSGTINNGGGIINNGTLILRNTNFYQNIASPNPTSLILNNGQLQIKGNTNFLKD